MTAAHLISRTPNKVLNWKTPCEILYNHKASVNHLRVFWCLCFAQNRMKGKDEFAPRSTKCIFLGYPFGTKGWKVFDLETQEIYISRDVVFYENIFSFEKFKNAKISEGNQQSDLGVGAIDDDLAILEEISLGLSQEEAKIQLGERGSLASEATETMNCRGEHTTGPDDKGRSADKLVAAKRAHV